MVDIRKLALEKEKDGGSLHPWLQSLESARLSLRLFDVKTEHLEEVIRASATPQHFTVFIRSIYRDSKLHPGESNAFEEICLAARQSPFPLSQWLSAHFEFELWCEKNHRTSSFPRALAYIKCSAELPDGQLPGQTLPLLVLEALEVYGLSK